MRVGAGESVEGVKGRIDSQGSWNLEIALEFGHENVFTNAIHQKNFTKFYIHISYMSCHNPQIYHNKYYIFYEYINIY